MTTASAPSPTTASRTWMVRAVRKSLIYGASAASRVAGTALAVTGAGDRTMTAYLLLLLSTALVNNVVLVKFLGLCPFMGISKKVDTAISMGLATTFVMTMASASCWLLEHWLLMPLGILYLRILVYILVIAAVVQFTEMVVRKTNPALYQVLGIYLPLITTNCAVLGIPLLTKIGRAHV
jgi:electron transport complex protein RnfA